MLEESERLIEIEENAEVVADPDIAQKLYERFQKRQKSKFGAIRNDKLDLIPLSDDDDVYEQINDDTPKSIGR